MISIAYPCFWGADRVETLFWRHRHAKGCVILVKKIIGEIRRLDPKQRLVYSTSKLLNLVPEDELLNYVDAGLVQPYPSLSVYGPDVMVYEIWDLARVNTKGDTKREAERLANGYFLGLGCPTCRR